MLLQSHLLEIALNVCCQYRSNAINVGEVMQTNIHIQNHNLTIMPPYAQKPEAYPWLIHTNRKPKLGWCTKIQHQTSREAHVKSWLPTRTHTNIHIQNQNMYISADLETSSKFNMQFSVTEPNICSANGKELWGQKSSHLILVVWQDLGRISTRFKWSAWQ